jgi:alpha-L-arabinofuranosidase
MSVCSRLFQPWALAALLTASLLLAATPVVWATDLQLSIDLAKPGSVINKNIYGQFAEHLGQGIYEGMWVGPKSKIPNLRGWRTDVVTALKELQVPLVRWPGGCFADEYHWRNGIGKQRPVTLNTNWGGVEESNAVGTHEFFDLAEQLGAETYINGNLGTGTPQEMAEWLEYMTSDSNSSLAQLRRKNGRDKPFHVDYFAVGNEAWGCGGHMSPEYYTNLYNHWATFLKTTQQPRPKYIASGGHTEDIAWADYLTAQIKPDWSLNFDALSFHYYTMPTGDWTIKGAATGFTEQEWISTLAATLRMDAFIANNKKVMDKNDPEKKVGFYVDEWGTWYDATPGTNPGFLNQQNSLRDAVVAALNFNIFHKHADRVHMTNIAQMVNVLQAMIITDKDKLILTPTYHAFKMYTPFQDATALPVTMSKVPEYRLGDKSIAAVSASAARGKDGEIYLALVNTNPKLAQTLTIKVAGLNLQRAQGQVLTAVDMDAHNSFAQPVHIQPEPFTASAVKGLLRLELPAKAVVVVRLE